MVDIQEVADPSFWAMQILLGWIILCGMVPGNNIRFPFARGGESCSGIMPLGIYDELGQVRKERSLRYTYDVGFDTDINP